MGTLDFPRKLGRWGRLAALAFLLAGAFLGAGAAPGLGQERFVIRNHAGFSEEEVRRVVREFEAGLRALEANRVPVLAGRFPVVANLRGGAGISHSRNGQGEIELYWVGEVRSPIIHEMVHVLAGYTAANGHWTQEGFASYMQDKYGEDAAFPTQKLAHPLAKLIIEENVSLPMETVMAARRRGEYFGRGTPWERWLAYTQSTSFVTYLIESYGLPKFLRIYNRPVEGMDFRGVYGKGAAELIGEWKSFLARVENSDPGKTRAIMRRARERSR